MRVATGRIDGINIKWPRMNTNGHEFLNADYTDDADYDSPRSEEEPRRKKQVNELPTSNAQLSTSNVESAAPMKFFIDLDNVLPRLTSGQVRLRQRLRRDKSAGWIAAPGKDEQEMVRD